MSMNKFRLIFLCFPLLTFSQTKKKVDTIFVHEKVVVYKKKSDRLSGKQAIRFDDFTKKKLAETVRLRPEIVADTSIAKMAVASKKSDRKKPKIFAIDNYGISVNSLFSQEPEIKSYGGGIGVFITKNIYRKKLFVNVECLFSKVFTKTNTDLIEGYYITPDEVLFYEPKNVNTQQINIPINLIWKYRKFKPQIGIAYTFKQTEFDFFTYKNVTPSTAIERVSYKLSSTYIDFMYAIEYGITKHFGITLKSKQTISNTNRNKFAENLKPLESLHFFPNQLIFGVVYNFKEF